MLFEMRDHIVAKRVYILSRGVRMAWFRCGNCLHKFFNIFLIHLLKRCHRHIDVRLMDMELRYRSKCSLRCIKQCRRIFQCLCPSEESSQYCCCRSCCSCSKAVRAAREVRSRVAAVQQLRTLHRKQAKKQQSVGQRQEWSEHFDESTGCSYYYNSRTRESTYQHPMRASDGRGVELTMGEFRNPLYAPRPGGRQALGRLQRHHEVVSDTSDDY